MTSRERMNAVLWDKVVPDKVPHGDLMIWPELIDALLGGETFSEEERMNYLFFWMSKTMGDHFFERDKTAREMLAFDYTHVFPSENWKKIDSTSDGSEIYRDPYGVEHTLTVDSISMHKSPLQDLESIVEYSPPHVDDFSFDNLEKWIKKSDLYTFLQIDSGLFKLYNILGFEQCMMAIVDHKQEIIQLMERLTEFQIALAQQAVRRGADCIWLSDDHTGVDSPFLSPELIREIDFQFQKRIVDEVHRMGRPCVMHSCGNLNKTIEGMIETGVDGIMGFQPTAHNDIERFKELYGDKVALVGNICVTELMPKGTPWHVDQEVKKLIGSIGKNGGYILSTCNALLHDEPIENVITLHLSAEKYGHYPLQL